MYRVSRWCCMDGHCSVCVGGGDLENRERVTIGSGLSQLAAQELVEDNLPLDPIAWNEGENL